MQLDPVRIIVFTVAVPMDAPGTSRRDMQAKLRDNFYITGIHDIRICKLHESTGAQAPDFVHTGDDRRRPPGGTDTPAGIDVMELQKVIEASANASGPGAGLATVLTIFSGGGLQQCGIFALGIMPYISASIMTQLLSAVVPQWAKMVREEGGRQKMTKWTRAIAIVIAIVQGWFLVGTLEHPDRLKAVGLNIPPDCQLVIDPGMQFALMTVLIMVAGTMFLMWIGDQITERGVGNGVSLIISVNIIHALPGAVTLAWKTLVYKDGAVVPMGAMLLVALIAFLIIVVALVVTVTQAQRRIPVQYAKRVMGNKMFNGATQYLPLKLNYSGVMPVIFATAILSLPQVLFSQIAHYNTTLQWIATKMNDWMNPASSGYYIISGLMIFFFSYFWVATMFQPSQIAEDLKRNGGYIPGIRPGPPTALFLDQTMQRLTFAGSAFLTLIYFLPSLLNIGGSIPYLVTQFFGGTSLLILVGVLLDMMRQVETTLLSRNYDGFLKKGKLKGKYGHIQGTGAAAGSRTVTVMWVVIALLVLAGAIAYNAMQ